MGAGPSWGRWAARASHAGARLPRAVSAVVVAVALLGTAPAGATDAEELAGTGVVRGVVSAADGPARFASVELTPVSPLGIPVDTGVRVSADGQGRFAFGAVPAGQYILQATSTSSRSVPTWWPDAVTYQSAGVIQVASAGGSGSGRAVPPAEVVADITLAAARRVTGRVLDADTGQPVAGARVLADLTGAAGIVPVVEGVRSDERGVFTLTGLPPARLTLLVQPSSTSSYLGTWYRTERTGPIPVVDASVEQRQDVLLQRGGVVSGRVRDATGAPVADALVTLRGCRGACPDMVRSQADGTYRIVGIPPEDLVYLTVRAANPPPGSGGGVQGRDSELFRVGAGTELAGLDLVLPASARVTGHVYGVDLAQPLDGLVVMLRPVGQRGRYLARFGESSDPTEFVIGPVPAGTYRLVVRPTVRIARYQPIRWAASTGVPLTGLLELAAGAAVDVTVRLATSAFPPVATQQWPELSAGFLSSLSSDRDAPGTP